MDKVSNAISENPRRIYSGWILTAVVVLGSLIGFASFTKNASAGANAAGLAQAVAPTMQPMPGMVMPTVVPATPQTQTGNDMDTLIQKMEVMRQSLQGVMGQLDQKSANVFAQPTASPAITMDMQAVMGEIQSINQAMGPLMQRIQADLQGTPTIEELTNVRAQVKQMYQRMAALVAKLQAAQGSSMPTELAAPTMTSSMPGNAQQPAQATQPDQSQMLISKFDQMMQKMQGLVQQMQTQQSPGMSGQNGSMPSMSMASPTPMPGMGSTSGMSNSDPSMNDMMSMMDNMMMMMDNMMGMGNMSGNSNPTNTMTMSSTAPMPGMSTTPGMPSADPAMSGMMMDDMMMMMDKMMSMMDGMMMDMDMMDMMGMPDM